MNKTSIRVGLVCGVLSFAFACGGDDGDDDTSENPTAGTGGSTAGAPAPTAGTGGAPAAGSSAAGSGGRAGNPSMGGSGGASGTGGVAAGSGGTGGMDDEDSGLVDPCDDLDNACDSAGRSCDGDDLVVCAANSAGCLVETRTDCTAGANVFCDEDASPPACKGDPCLTSAGRIKPGACTEEGATCVDDVLVECVEDDDGCPIAERIDCTLEDDFNACAIDGDDAECVDDPCRGISNCTEVGTSCRGTDLVTCAERGANDCLVEQVRDCTATSGETCDDSGATARCDDCEDDPGCDSAGTSCDGDVFQTCSDTDGDDCLELTEETCSDSCDDDDGCVFALNCDGALAATLREDASYGPFNTQNAGNEFVQFGCAPGAEDGPDLLFAVDIPAQTSVSVSLVGPDFETSAPTIFLLTDCSDAGAGNAEDSCAADSTTAVTRINGGNETVRVYVVVDASGAANFGTFGLALDARTIECGDGVVDNGEQCDDGNTAGGDGCTATCRIANGFACTEGEPSVCTERPTDGTCGNLRCELPTDAPQGSQLCCTADQACGLAYPPAYGAHCFELAQAGTDDNGCDDEDSTQPLNWPTLTGCCRPDGYCGLTAGVGLGCVRRSEVWTALQDGPGNLYTGPFNDEDDCN